MENNESHVMMQTMMEYMSSMKDSLQEVAGGTVKDKEEEGGFREKHEMGLSTSPAVARMVSVAR
jgi:hypothetical protein